MVRQAHHWVRLVNHCSDGTRMIRTEDPP